MTPATGLHDKQAVQVSGVGFTPGEQLTVVQCADKGTNTGPGDCNLSAMTPIAADAKGTGTATLTVVAGPFGGNKIDCRKQRCLISMTQATPSPTEEADSPISFAAN